MKATDDAKALRALEEEQLEIRSTLRSIYARGEKDPAKPEAPGLVEKLGALEERCAGLKKFAEPVRVTATETDPEQREIAALKAKALFGRALNDMHVGGRLQGPEAELSAALGCNGGLTLALLEERPAPEQRAAATIPSTTEGTSPPILGEVFTSPVASFVGATRPTVPMGKRVYNYVSTGATAGTPAQGTAVTESSVAISGASATPGRVTAQIRYQIEDAYTIEDLEDGLRRNAREAVAAKLEAELMSALQVDAVATAPTTTTTVITFGAFLGKLAGAIDAKFAPDLRGVRCITNADAAAKLEATAPSNSPEITAAIWARQHSGGFMASAHAKADASTDSELLLVRGAQRGLMSVIQPVWDTVMVEDAYTDAGKGERLLTLIVLSTVVVPRTGAFKRDTVHLS